jgi:hypothetical protein
MSFNSLIQSILGDTLVLPKEHLVEMKFEEQEVLPKKKPKVKKEAQAKVQEEKVRDSKLEGVIAGVSGQQFMLRANELLEEIGKTHSMLDVACSQAKQTLENLK